MFYSLFILKFLKNREVKGLRRITRLQEAEVSFDPQMKKVKRVILFQNIDMAVESIT